MRVLVAEDHERLARAVAAGLRRYGMVVDVALDGDDALARLGSQPLRRGGAGPGPARHPRRRRSAAALAAERCESRVLMLTAASSVKDRVEGLGLGADDYLPKPFDFAEMVARVQALGRRPGAAQPDRPGLRRPDPGPRQTARGPRRATPGAQPEGVRRPGMPARRRGKAGLGRGTARTGVGRRRPTRSPRPSRPPSTGCGPSSATRR